MHVGDSRIELLAPLGADTPVGRFLEKRGPGMHHVAYEVTDIRAALADAAARRSGADRRPARGSDCSGSRWRSFIPRASMEYWWSWFPIENWS